MVRAKKPGIREMANKSGTNAAAATGAIAASTARGKLFNIVLDFAGAASVDIERKMPGSENWIKKQVAITADADILLGPYPEAITIRLNPTSATDAVEWAIAWRDTDS